MSTDLKEIEFEILAEEKRKLSKVTHVIHSAANTSYYAKDEEICSTNVEGTKNFYSFMVENAPNLQKFVHVSSAFACGVENSGKASKQLMESEYPTFDTISKGNHFYPYTLSKAKCELVLTQLAKVTKSSDKLVIVRPSIIVGNTQTGCLPSGSIFFAFRVINALKAIAWPFSYKIDVVPVDWTADAIAHLTKKSLSHSVYHLSSGEFASDWTQISEAFSKSPGGCFKCSSASRDATEKYILVSLEELRKKNDRWPKCFPASVRYMINLYSKYAMLNVTFNNQRIIAEGILPPEPFHNYIPQCMSFPADLCVKQQLEEDF